MKKIHISTLKFHTIFTIILIILFTITTIFVRDILLAVVMLFVIIYVAGNGMIHSKKNQLTRDTLIEYVLVSVIVLVVLVGAFL